MKCATFMSPAFLCKASACLLSVTACCNRTGVFPYHSETLPFSGCISCKFNIGHISWLNGCNIALVAAKGGMMTAREWEQRASRGLPLIKQLGNPQFIASV